MGFAVGFDHQITPTALVGIAAGYTDSRFSVKQLMTRGAVEGAHVGFYGVTTLGPLYLAAAADYAHLYNEADRSIDWILDERATSEFTSDEFGARLEGGWKSLFAGINVTPFVGLDVSHLRSDSFAEQSRSGLGNPGILGLSFGEHSTTSLASSLGIQFDTRIVLPGGQALTPFARIAWAHEFYPDRSLDAYLTLSPAAAFSPEAASAASDVAKAKAGLRLDVTGNLGLFASFEGEFSSEGQSYTGGGGIKLSW